MRVDGSGSVTLRNCEITNNFGLLGGPSALLSAGQVRIESSLIARNTASIVIDASGELQLFSTTIADNVDGPSVVSRGSLEVERSVIWGNCDAGDVVALVGSAVFTCSAVDSSSVSGGAQIIFGNGVVYADVEFCQTLGCESSEVFWFSVNMTPWVDGYAHGAAAQAHCRFWRRASRAAANFRSLAARISSPRPASMSAGVIQPIALWSRSWL